MPNAAGTGFWVVGIELNTNKIMAFEVTSTGIGPIVESTMGYTDASVHTSLALTATAANWPRKTGSTPAPATFR